jgi:hypothetical protein
MREPSPGEIWHKLPDVKTALETPKWVKETIQTQNLLVNEVLIAALERKEKYLIRVIEMLESDEHYHVRGTKHLPHWGWSKAFVSILRQIVEMDSLGKFAPEARPFMARRLRQVLPELSELIVFLKNSNMGEIIKPPGGVKWLKDRMDQVQYSEPRMASGGRWSRFKAGVYPTQPTPKKKRTNGLKRQHPRLTKD